MNNIRLCFEAKYLLQTVNIIKKNALNEKK